MGGGPHPPLEVILTWKPNYVNPESRGWTIVIIVSVLLAVTYFVVALRIWARLRLSKNFGIDDGLILFNLIPLTGTAVALGLAFRLYGFNHHVWDNPISVLLQSRQITMALEQLYMISTVTTKISILLFYRRLGVGAVTPGFLYCVYAAIAFVVAYFITFTFTLWLHCRPISAFWMQVDPSWAYTHQGEYHCINEAANLIAASVISVVQDFIACGMPMVLFWRIRIPRRQKIALAGIFGVGFFLCICGVLRIVYTIPIYYHTHDMTWGSYPAWIWFAVESHLAVICASAPALKVYLKGMNVSTIMSSWKSGSRQENGTGSMTIELNDRRSGGRTLDETDLKYPAASQFHYDPSESSEQLTDRYMRTKFDSDGDVGTGLSKDDFGALPPHERGATDTWMLDPDSRSRHRSAV